MLEDKEFPLISYGKKLNRRKGGGGEAQVIIDAALSSSLFWLNWDTQGYLLH